MAAARAPGLGLLAGILALGQAQPAQAQLSGSVAVASDVRLRGFSLTERRPAITLSAAYDDRSGLYAGGSVIVHDPEAASARLLGHTEYLGYAVRADNGLSWDVGVANIDVTLYRDRKYPLQYSQIYVGVARDSLSARLSLSPDFPRKGMSSAYLDLNGVVRPAEDWRVAGHVGVMRRLGGVSADGRRQRYDLRLAVTRSFDNLELQAAWTGLVKRPEPRASRTHSGVQVGASYFF